MAKFNLEKLVTDIVRNANTKPKHLYFLSKESKIAFDRAMKKEVENWQKRKDNKNKQRKKNNL